MRNPDTKMYNFRGPRNVGNRLKRASAIRGISQSGIILLALERELSRWEKEYAQQRDFRNLVVQGVVEHEKDDESEE